MTIGYSAGILHAAPDLLDDAIYGDVFALVDRTDAEKRGFKAIRESFDTVRILDALRDAGKIRAAADRMIVRLILDAREAGKTWDEIGSSLGMTRQGVHLIVKRSGAAKL